MGRNCEVIIVGGGHAGCEAALAVSKMGLHGLLITQNVDDIGALSCNPAIGGLAKSHLVREVDVFRGAIAEIGDSAGIQFRLLNRSKGPAVQSPRVQIDQDIYREKLKRHLFGKNDVSVRQGIVKGLLVKGRRVRGVRLLDGDVLECRAVVIAAGTFLNGTIFIGLDRYDGGRTNEKSSVHLPESMKKAGIRMGRFKTGTSARIHRRSIDVSRYQEQKGDEEPVFLSERSREVQNEQVSCYAVYTNAAVHAVIRRAIDRSPLYSGKIVGRGPRYCPSVEDKVMRFPEKARHQVFIEPIGLRRDELYLNGLSSSLPVEVQEEFLRKMDGFENVEIVRPGYAVEYDYVLPGQTGRSLESTRVDGLFLAGQILGTSGYEEAAAQGLVAGINAALKVKGDPPYIIGRGRGYIGVMLEDITCKTVDEPYRMFTSRSENRLSFGIDTAEERLIEDARKLGFLTGEEYEEYQGRLAGRKKILDEMKKKYVVTENSKGVKVKKTLAQVVRMVGKGFKDIEGLLDSGTTIEEEKRKIEYQTKYEGYIDKEKREVVQVAGSMRKRIPDGFDFEGVEGISRELKEKLLKKRPGSLEEAAKISGMTPAALSILRIKLRRGG
jgi:tRNA uridine 5-carboxymethylaminomethyl modification enzyme